MQYKVLVGGPEGKRPFRNAGVDCGIILKWIFKQWNGQAWTELIWLRIGADGGPL